MICRECVEDRHDACRAAECACAEGAHALYQVPSEAHAALMLQALARHFGDPVRPLRDFTAAFEAWADAVREASRENPALIALSDATATVTGAVRKSNLLKRVVYHGEAIRTRKCPSHQGRWSGKASPTNSCPFGCEVQGELTGWLPEPAREGLRAGAAH